MCSLRLSHVYKVLCIPRVNASFDANRTREKPCDECVIFPLQAINQNDDGHYKSAKKFGVAALICNILSIVIHIIVILIVAITILLCIYVDHKFFTFL